MLTNNHQIQLFCAGNTNIMHPQSSSTFLTSSSSTSSSTSSLASYQNQRSSTMNTRQSMMNMMPPSSRNSSDSNNRMQTQTWQSTNINPNNNNQVQSNPVQIQNYITWINSHLKKRPGVKLVENLHLDLSNGVSLIHLIEVISGTVLTDVNLNPKSQVECKENIEKILKFMQNNSIKMHQTTSKEIIEGNLKSIMRLILALAAHFKPTNVQPYSAFMSKMNSNSNSNTNTNSNNQTTSTSSSSSTSTSTTTTNSTSSNHTCTASSSLSSNPNNKQQNNFMINKRSQSTNNVNTNTNLNTNSNTNSNSNTNLNNTYVVNQATNQINQNNNLNNNNNNNQLHQKQIFNQTRNLDSMTHLVQAACVSLADVRKYKNENFNIKYVKRNNLQSPTSKMNSNYLNPINLNTNQTYTVNNKTVDFSPKNSTMISTASFLLSPNSAQPIASSTVLQPPLCSIIDNTATSIDNITINKKYTKNKTYSLEKQDKILEEECDSKNDKKDDNLNLIEKNKNLNSDELNNENNKHSEIKIIEPSITNQNQNNSSSNNEETVGKTSDNNNNNNSSQNLKDDLLQYNLEENEINLNEVQDVKNILLNLQTLLMNCNLEDLRPSDLDLNNFMNKNADNNQDENVNNNYDGNTSTNSSSSEINNGNPLSSLTLEEQISIFRSKIQQLEILNTDLKNELNQFKNEAINKNGIQSGLKSRLSEQDNTILEMKNEQLTLQLNNQNLVKEKDDLKEQLNSCLKQINQLKSDLANKDSAIERMKIEMNEILKQKHEETKFVRQQVKQVTDTLEIVQEKENALSGMIASTDRKLNILNNNLANKKELTLLANLNQKTSLTIINQEEFNMFKESVLKLRQNFSSNHPSQILINVVEQTLNNMIDRSNPNTHLNSISSLTSSSSSGSSSLTSSSANSPVLPLAQSQSPSSTSSVHSSSSSISGLSYNQKSNTHIESSTNTTNNSKNDNLIEKQNELPMINNESNVKKIISRLLSQTYVMPPGQLNQQQPPLPSNQTKNEISNQTKSNKLTHMWESHVTNLNNNKPPSTLLTISSACTTTSSTSTTVSSNYSNEIISNQVNIPLSTNNSNNSNLLLNNLNITKCVYYIDKNSTPFMTTINKNIGSITLNEFKECIKLKPGNYKFRFRSQDPEFGTLKEEISNDYKILPSYDGKIVAWIETLTV